MDRPASTNSLENKDLLTTDGIRASIVELKPVRGTSKVTSFVVHPEPVSAQALVKGSTKCYGRFSYAGGGAADREGAGGTVMSGVEATDVEDINWACSPSTKIFQACRWP